MKKIAVEIKHGHVFCGIGGGAKGMNRGKARLGNLRAKFRCVGGVDVDAGAIKSFGRLAGVPGTVIDLFTLEQYRAFHGHMPPPGWREAVPADIQKAFGFESPNIGFMSSPCKGFSGLLSQAKSETSKYRALNELALRGLWLYLEAFKDDPSEFILFENVPRIQTRGRPLLDQIIPLLQAYGYATAETTHDCGEIGGLAQSRKRFLLVARHQDKVPAFLYQAPIKPLRAVGSVLEKFPLPGDASAGPMHRSPALQWKTWVRLAFVEAGSDWRSLKKLNVKDGYLTDYLIVPERRADYLGVLKWGEHAGAVSGRGGPTNGRYAVGDPRTAAFHGAYGVQDWGRPSCTVTSQSLPSSGNFGVADPRFDWKDGAHENKMRVSDWDAPARAVTGSHQVGSGALSIADPRVKQSAEYQQLGVRSWDAPTGTVSGQSTVGGGSHAIADPRLPADGRFNNVYRIVSWSEHAPSVTAGAGPTAGGVAVADPRSHSGFGGKGKYIVTPFDAPTNTVIAESSTGNGASAVADPRTGFGASTHHNVLHVTPWDAHAKTVTGANHPSGGALAVSDPRPKIDREKGDHYITAGHYGVLPWDSPAYAVTAHASHDNGSHSVADPRLPDATDRLVCVIVARDGTWHRPFTTLELAALQSLVEPEEHLMLEGMSDSQWREWIGNCVPPDAAEAIASLMGRTILGSMKGEGFMLTDASVWVRPIAIAISMSRAM